MSMCTFMQLTVQQESAQFYLLINFRELVLPDFK